MPAISTGDRTEVEAASGWHHLRRGPRCTLAETGLTSLESVGFGVDGLRSCIPSAAGISRRPPRARCVGAAL